MQLLFLHQFIRKLPIQMHDDPAGFHILLSCFRQEKLIALSVK
jgi:hypothetical protein